MDPLRALAVDDRALHPLWAGACLAVLVVVFTATAYAWTSVFAEEGRSPSSASATADTLAIDGQDVWIELLRVDSEAEAIAIGEVEVTVRGPDGAEVSTVCGTPRLVADAACQDPTQPSEAWSRADALWIPCRGEGGHRVTVLVRGAVLLDAAAGCDRAAFNPP